MDNNKTLYFSSIFSEHISPIILRLELTAVWTGEFLLSVKRLYPQFLYSFLLCLPSGT